MFSIRGLLLSLLGCFCIGLSGAYLAHTVLAQSEQALHIDVPVRLEKANVVFDMGHLVMSNGDVPFLLGDLNLLVNDFKEADTKLLLFFTAMPLIWC